MPRGRKSLLIEEIESLLRVDGSRFADMGATLRVYRCTCKTDHVAWPKGKDHSKHFAAPAELATPKIYGGRYDRLLRCYVGPAETTRELKCHEGQVQLLTLTGDDVYGRPLDSDEVLRILAIGAPGAGKTLGAVTRALLMALDRPNSTGGLIGPTGDRRQILWDGFLDICPREWIQDVKNSKKEIVLCNNTVIQVLAAKSSSSQFGSPLQGRSFDWAVPDESQNIDDAGQTEIATRGRRAGGKYRIFETATNAQVPAFRVRLEQFKTNKAYRRINFTGYQNPWVEPAYWEKMRGDMSEREFREKILAEDLPPERMVYPRFSLGHNVAPRGRVPGLSDIERARLGTLIDVTEKITHERFGVASKYIIAQDFGVLINAAEVLKAYQPRTGGDLYWWAIDEITSGGGTDLHAGKLKSYYDPGECVVIADPHFNTKDSDKSDYNIMRAEGWDVHPSTHGKISVKHRIAMFNALLEDANGRRRFYVDCDASGLPKCTRLVRSLISSQLNDYGEAEKDRKNGASDPSHWPSAVQFGLFHWERTHGGQSIKAPGETKKNWWEEG